MGKAISVFQNAPRMEKGSKPSCHLQEQRGLFLEDASFKCVWIKWTSLDFHCKSEQLAEGDSEPCTEAQLLGKSTEEGLCVSPCPQGKAEEKGSTE